MASQTCEMQFRGVRPKRIIETDILRLFVNPERGVKVNDIAFGRDSTGQRCVQVGCDRSWTRIHLTELVQCPVTTVNPDVRLPDQPGPSSVE